MINGRFRNTALIWTPSSEELTIDASRDIKLRVIRKAKERTRAR